MTRFTIVAAIAALTAIPALAACDSSSAPQAIGSVSSTPLQAATTPTDPQSPAATAAAPKTTPAPADPAATPSAKKTEKAQPAIDLRYTEGGHYIDYDYTDEGPLGIKVYKPGGLGATSDSPVLAGVTLTTKRRGSVGTAQLTITSKYAVLFYPGNFTWDSHAVGNVTGPTTSKDVTVPAGTHHVVLTFPGVAKGKLTWKPGKTEDFEWQTH